MTRSSKGSLLALLAVGFFATAHGGEAPDGGIAGGVDLSWHTVDGGGATFSTGDDFTLGGTIGQPDAGVPMTGGGFSLTGGFWPGAGGPEIDTCPADIAPLPSGDAIVNVLDLLALIGQWGACPLPCPPSCPADLSGDCTVNVTDLLAVISAWGACPP
ncbi:MAG: hypothetical protein L0Y44_15870 [Phycisphaerales bacterium]|nr:hypothetical protein [Phycisphaerales bacterium]